MTLADLTDDLLWPKVLRAARMALSPARLGLAFATIVGLLTIDRVWQGIWGTQTARPVTAPIEMLQREAGHLAGAVWSLNTSEAVKAVLEIFVYGPLQLVREHWPLAIVSPLALAMLAIGGTAISRSAACEFAGNVRLPWTRALAFALSRVVAVVSAFFGPLIIVWAICAALLIAGWVLFRLPVVNVAGGLLFGPMLLASGLAVLLMLAYVCGKVLLAPAVACDDADGFDAVQRAYAYTLAHPGRLVIYLSLLAAQAVVVTLLLSVLLLGTVKLGTHLTGAPSSPLIGSAAEATAATDAAAAGWSDRLASTLVGAWITAAYGVSLAFGISVYFTGGTIVYLLMRRITDGQDETELWTPGTVSGTMAPVAGSQPPPLAPSGPVAAVATGQGTEKAS